MPIALVAWLFFDHSSAVTSQGLLLAILSGSVTSGLGYALWYRVLPEINATTGALSQLSVPVIALAAGVIILGEVVTWSAYLATFLIISGITIGILWPRLFSANDTR